MLCEDFEGTSAQNWDTSETSIRESGGSKVLYYGGTNLAADNVVNVSMNTAADQTIQARMKAVAFHSLREP
jgi:hypothetical protein